MRFTWDPKKAASNLRKHGVSFAEAATAFDDDRGAARLDALHDEDEERCILVAYSDPRRVGLRGHPRLLVCVYVEVDEGVTRIISARKASPLERRRHEEGIA